MTTNAEYIRTAVELADGFSVVGIAGLFLHMDVKDEEFPYHIQTSVEAPSQFFEDALAAQLVRQVDMLDNPQCGLQLARGVTVVDIYLPEAPLRQAAVDGDDRTMNTIKAIIDSEVLS